MWRCTHIDPHKPASLPHPIGLVLYAIGEAAFLRLGRHLRCVAVNIKLPTVIQASQAAFFISAEEERRFAMGTILAENSDATITIAKGNQVLAKQADADGITVGSGKLLRQQRWNPMAPLRASPSTRHSSWFSSRVSMDASFSLICALESGVLILRFLSNLMLRGRIVHRAS